ncbi:MAG: SMP-30/gluconolactonase/LRE family protein, partial [Gemmatimonadota bacterium]|nr:SMP-30/gluconolactonase/LRE family protein [Gemmatimonadota bacterium]
LATLVGVTTILSCMGDEPAVEELTPVSYPTTGSIERLDLRLDAIVPQDAVIEVLSEGHEWVEGPVWVPELQSILYSDIPNNAVYRWSEGEEASLWLQPAGFTGAIPREGESGSNGLALDAEGKLVLAQHGDRRLARMEAPWGAPAPMFETLVGEYEGKRFNSPNDVALRTNGDLYFTDPPYGLQGGNEEKELDFQGVYRLAASGSLTLLTNELSRPNGIAFSPDQSILYVANSDGANQPVVMAYDVESDGGINNGRVFFESWGDGMAVDQEGNVYVTGPRGGVLVINADGEHLGTLLAPPRTSNATFGEDGSTLFVTANTRLVRIRLNVKGVGF